MSDIVIRVANLSKRYTIRHHANGHRSGDGLRHALQDVAGKPFQALKLSFRGKSQVQGASTSTLEFNSVLRSSSEDFWALKDVSFAVKRGEVLGIIGRNGAGKSTLLKVLSRITEPTKGGIGLNGRVASLLEVGTGFHHELTGRENIYLNGAILGMSRAEVRRKFEEIVEFASVEKFLDTAVKHYSSGMYVRLAFAVAAHLEPEILIVDEVLAVGDAEFQQKCLGKMKEVSQEQGRAILFVSHDLSAVAGMCDTAIYLRGGELASIGPASQVLENYRQDISKAPTNRVRGQVKNESNAGEIRSLTSSLVSFDPRTELQFTANITCNPVGGRCNFSMHIFDDRDVNVTTLSTEYLQNRWLEPGDHCLTIVIHAPWLAPGSYRINAFLYGPGAIIDEWNDACRFEIGPNVTSDRFSSASSRNTGKVLCDFTVSSKE